MSRLLQDSLLMNARCQSDNTALIAGNVRVSYREVTNYACRQAHALRSRGVNHGDRIAIFMDNTWQCALSIYGVLLAGGAFVAISAQTQQDKPALKILRTANAKTLPASVENMDDLLAAYGRQTLSFPKVRRVTDTAAAPLCFMLIAVISKETLCPDYCKKPYC